jgi:hypothetical protein
VRAFYEKSLFVNLAENRRRRRKEQMDHEMWPAQAESILAACFDIQ